MAALNSWLEGVRVLDLSQYLPGPLASLLLADFGADVLKIEAPHGDEMRKLGPRDKAGNPIFYESVNAGKRVRRMDLKQPAVRAEFLQWVEAADVLMESFRPGVMARLGLDYATVCARNPGIVYCSLSGYGVGGPLEQAAGHDANYLAQAGLLHRNGDDAPNYFDPPVADTAASLFAVIAIQGALRAKQRGGQGCFIDMAIADVAAPLQLFRVADYGARGYSPAPGETYLNGGVARYRVYRTADDRHIALGALEEKFWRCFCTTAGRSEWIGRIDEPLPQTALAAELAGFFAGLSMADCVTRFAAPDCCVTPVLSVGESIQSAYSQQRDLVRRAPWGQMQALFPARVNGEAPATRAPLREV